MTHHDAITEPVPFLTPRHLSGERDVRSMVADYYAEPLVHVLPSPEGDMVDYRTPVYHTPLQGYLQASAEPHGSRGYLWTLVFIGWIALAGYPFVALLHDVSISLFK